MNTTVCTGTKKPRRKIVAVYLRRRSTRLRLQSSVELPCAVKNGRRTRSRVSSVVFLQLCGAGAQLLCGAQHLFAVPVKVVSRGRQAETPARTLYESNAHRAFERRDLLRDRRLRNAASLCRRRETSAFDSGVKILHASNQPPPASDAILIDALL